MAYRAASTGSLSCCCCRFVGVEGQSVEISNTVDIRGEFNREIAMRITSDLNSSDRFFTDLNGYQVGHGFWHLLVCSCFFPYRFMLSDPGNPLPAHCSPGMGGGVAG